MKWGLLVSRRVRTYVVACLYAINSAKLPVASHKYEAKGGELPEIETHSSLA